MNNIRKNQINRVLRKEKRKRKAKLRLVAVGIAATMSLTLAYFSLFNGDKASADTAQIIQHPQVQDANTIYSDTDQLENTYQSIAISYKRVVKDAEVYQTVSNNPKLLFKLKAGDYVSFYGQENTWAKIANDNQMGYIQYDKLEDTKEDELVVRAGYLMDGKDYKFPDDFETVFDINTENSMLVMIEAMKREGLNIDVARRYLTEEEFNQNQETSQDSNYEEPDYSNHTLRTGMSIELRLEDQDGYIDFDQTSEGRWLRDNAHKYGFILRYPIDKENVTGFVGNNRIYRYVGVDIASKMHENQQTFEEYFGL